LEIEGVEIGLLGCRMMKWMRGVISSAIWGVWAGLSAVGADEGWPSASWGLIRERGAALLSAGAIAPESLNDVLGLLYLGAAGETAAQMKAALFEGGSPEAVEAEMSRREKALNGYRVLHGIWRSQETVVHPVFEAKAGQSWGVHLGVWADGASREQRASEINDWFAEKTRGNLVKVIDADELRENSAFFGVLVAAFSAPWVEDIFAFGVTRPELFYATAEKRFVVSMMAASSLVDYAEDKDFQFIRIGYAGSRLWLYVLLPKRAAEADAVFAKADHRRWQALASLVTRRTVRLSLPKVDVRERIDWRQRLMTEFGLERPFLPGGGDFSNFAKHPDGPLYLSSLVQSIRVQWDERGTRAEAATVYSAEPFGDASKSAPEVPPVFLANHPFAYVIGDISRGRVLFAGRISRREQMPLPGEVR
jgi:serpin B